MRMTFGVKDSCVRSHWGMKSQENGNMDTMLGCGGILVHVVTLLGCMLNWNMSSSEAGTKRVKKYGSKERKFSVDI